MSVFSEYGNPDITRREFLSQATALAGLCILNCDLEARQQEPLNIEKALNDAKVVHGKVSFKSREENISGYLARPNSRGRFPVVVVVSGSSIDDEYIRNTTAMLAQDGFVGIAPDIYSLQQEGMTVEERRRILAERMTDDVILQDIQASIDYLTTQKFANTQRVGITGFCFGGRCALIFAAVHPNRINAVVPFYGNLRTPSFANRQQDPLDVVEKIKAPVQGHYAETDREIPLDQLKQFEVALRKNRVAVEIFTYPANHGFFAYNRPTYDPGVAKLSWQRAVAFLKKHSGK